MAGAVGVVILQDVLSPIPTTDMPSISAVSIGKRMLQRCFASTSSFRFFSYWKGGFRLQGFGMHSVVLKSLSAKQFLLQNVKNARNSSSKCFVSKCELATAAFDDLVPVSPLQLLEARVIYCAAPALGHNQETHPECNARVPGIIKALETAELTPEFRGKEVVRIDNFSHATVDDVAAVHSRSYVLGLEKAMEKAGEVGLICVEGSGPTYATPTTYAESLRAAGAGMALVDSVVAASKKTRTPPIGFALIRPPGHHAVMAGPMGFCIFGNVSIAARYAQRKHGLRKIFIIDFDVHHGNGTNDVFYEDPDIFFLSTHQAGSYPGTGKIHEIGKGYGEGATLNLPLPGGSGDQAMSAVFEEVVVPAAQRFKPDILLVSAGYDAHVLDPLAGLQFTTGTYYRLAANIKELAQNLCQGRCVFFLEGGYNIKALSDSVSESFRAFLGDSSISDKIDNPAILYDEPSLLVKKAIDEIKCIHLL